jgi:hypothetical protein
LERQRGDGPFVITSLRKGDVFDRVQLQEDTAVGQRVRKFTVDYKDGSAKGEWKTIAQGEAIGTKAIKLLDAPITVEEEGAALRLVVNEAIATPEIEEFAVFAPCATK